MKQFRAFVKKEFYHVFRDRKTLLLLFGLPLAQIILFGFALTNEIKDSRIVVCDFAHDVASQRMIEKVSVSKQFLLQETVMNRDEMEAAMKRDDIRLALIFPANFNNDLQHLKKAQIQVIADASDPNTATTLTSYINNIVADYSRESTTGEAPSGFQIVPQIRMLYNPELKGVTNFVPGVMALVLMLVCVLMTSVSIVKEKETGTMEILLVSPVNPFIVIIAKAVPYFALSLINLSLILFLSVFLLGMPMNGSLTLLFMESSLLIITCLALGLLISNSTNSQQAAMLVSLMGMLVPTLLLSGFMFPLENMPLPLQIFANVLPSKWYYIIVKSIMIKGLGLAAIWKETLVLVFMATALLLLSYKRFKIRLQ
ncbi:MAG: ABC transporter permease [Chitinophagaceae bacterium]